MALIKDRKKRIVAAEEKITTKRKEYAVVDPYVRTEEGQPQQVSGYVQRKEKGSDKQSLRNRIFGEKQPQPKTRKQKEKEAVQQFVEVNKE